MNYYNEFEKYPAQWLRNLSEAGVIPKGVVNERDIRNVAPDELREYTQCHFFSGIGGWSYALRLAGWPDERPVWTGSCPCQPFSNAGKGRGVKDERHLWPAFRWLIAQCRPATIFGEQVASKAGREWLSGVRADLEAMGYAVGAADLCAAGVGAPHIRQRLFWMANMQGTERQQSGKTRKRGIGIAGSCSWVANRPSNRYGEPKTRKIEVGRQGENIPEPGCSGELQNGFERCCGDSGLADSPDTRTETVRGRKDGFYEAWSDYILIPCADGKERRIESRIMPLAHGVSKRVGAIKAYGNAIVPQIAAEFIKSCTEVF